MPRSPRTEPDLSAIHPHVILQRTILGPYQSERPCVHIACLIDNGVVSGDRVIGLIASRGIVDPLRPGVATKEHPPSGGVLHVQRIPVHLKIMHTTLSVDRVAPRIPAVNHIVAEDRIGIVEGFE